MSVIEDLNKTQLILLTLLVTFVVAIGTSIITFSLLQEAPPTVTQTINRVVERTIEQVVPEGNNEGNGQTIREVTTVVVKEEDQVVDAIDKVASNVVRIYDDVNIEGFDSFYGLGVVISNNGLIVAPSRDSFNAAFVYSATFTDGSKQRLTYLGQDNNKAVTFFRVAPQGSASFSTTPASPSFADLKLGQTVVAIGGRDKNVVTVARVGELSIVDPSGAKTQKGVALDITQKGDVIGSPIVNLSGEVVGFRTGQQTSSGSVVYVSPNYLKQSIEDYKKQN